MTTTEDDLMGGNGDDANAPEPVVDTPSAAARRGYVPLPPAEFQVPGEVVPVCWSECQRRLGRLEGAMSKASTRLDHGTKAFDEVRASITAVALEAKAATTAAALESKAAIEQLKPRPSDRWAVIGTVAGIVVVALTAWWTLSQSLGDRPTTSQVDKILSEHVNSDGHPAMANEIKAMREAQAGQASDIRNLGTKIDETRQDIKDLAADVHKLRPR